MFQLINFKGLGIIDKIYIFQKSQDDLQELFEKEPKNEMFKNLHSQAKKNPEKVVFINNNIYIDDTIDTLKKKIILALNKTISYEEIYLFAEHNEIVKQENVFNILTQNETIKIEKIRLLNFLSNLSNFDASAFQEKDTYTYEDILSLQIAEKQSQKVALGIKYNLMNSYPVSVNPFDVKEFDKIVKNSESSIVTTYNKDLILDYNVIKGSIYMCLAENVLNFFKEDENVDSSILCELYYPYLFKKNITNLSTLSSEKYKLVDNNNELINSTFLKHQENIDLFHEIYNKQPETLSFISRGIKSINFIIHPFVNISIPMDIIIKLLKTNEKLIAMKYVSNKSSRGIFRLFTDGITRDGKKIPLIKSGKISKVSKNISQANSVGLYMKLHENESSVKDFFITFFSNGNIQIKMDNVKAISLDTIEQIVKENLNPLLKTINLYLESSGFTYSDFNGFENNIEVLDINYILYLSIEKNVVLSKYLKCISNIFNVVEDDLKKKIILDFKKVSNFNTMNSIDTYISRLFVLHSQNENLRETMETIIIPKLEENFSLSHEDASTQVNNWVDSNLKFAEENKFENKKISIKSNPGFNVFMNYESLNKNLFISVENINNISYLKTLPVYFNGLIRLTQNEVSYIDSKVIEKICYEREIVDGVTYPEPLIEDEEKTYEEIENIENDGLIQVIKESDKIMGDEFELDIATDSEEETESESESENESESESEAEDNPEQVKEKEVDTQPKPKPEVKSQKSEKKSKTKPKETEKLEKEFAGMKLKYPNPFYQKLIDHDPDLFIKKKDGKFNSYSRTCLGDWDKHPVMLTDEEKEKIDKEHPGSYIHAIKYGSTKDKERWYICPRYWCFKDNTSLTDAEVKAGKCGGKVIPNGAKTIPKDHFIYEFLGTMGNQLNPHIDKKTGEYVEHAPSFIDSTKHPKGLYMPCCFKTKDRKLTKSLLSRIEKSGATMYVPGEEQKEEEQKEDQVEKEQREQERIEVQQREKEQREKERIEVERDYIKEPSKFPLYQGNRGFLPLNVQKLVGFNNEKCLSKKSDKMLKENVNCLLRKGVNYDKTQSFISCLADIYSYKRYKSILSNKKMKREIIKKLNIDIFINLQNGNLIDTFYDETKNVNIEPYKESNLFLSLPKENVLIQSLFEKICNSFECFIDFLKDDNVVIDYTYIWDFVSKYLFDKRVNLIILEIPDNDLTQNIEIICPTNVYSNVYFNTNFDNIILIKKDNFYEPIYSYMNIDNSLILTNKMFNLHSNTIIPALSNAIKKIKDYLVECNPTQKKINEYIFKNNISFEEIRTRVKENYNVLGQLINYKKTIGLLLQNKETNNTVLVPSNPNFIVPDLKIYTSEDEEAWNTYENTVKELELLHKNHSLPCKPFAKFIEDELIVGVLTETNQLVKLSKPVMRNSISDDIKEIKVKTDRYETNKNTVLSKQQDETRLKVIKRIKLEQGFYNAFRNTIRKLLNNYEFFENRKQIEEVIDNDDLYLEKLKKLIGMLREISDKAIAFKDYEDIETIDKVFVCYEKSNCEEFEYCQLSNNKCVLNIPKFHLINKQNNENIYYGKLADELLRYFNIRKFMFNPSQYLNFDKLGYNLGKNEIILLGEIVKSYFENLIPVNTNKYVKAITYDEANKKITKNIDENVKKVIKPKEKIIKEDIKEDVKEDVKEDFKYQIVITREKWKKFFPKKIYKKIFTKPNINTYNNLFLDIINDFVEGNFTLQQIKEKLIQLYKETKKSIASILQVWNKEGKKTVVQDIKKNQYTIEEYIISESYYFTDLDIILLMNHFKIPLFLISATKLDENGKDSLSLNVTDKNTFYYIVKKGGIKINQTQDYTQFFTGNKQMKFQTAELSGDVLTKIKTNVYDIKKIWPKNILNIKKKL